MQTLLLIRNPLHCHRICVVPSSPSISWAGQGSSSELGICRLAAALAAGPGAPGALGKWALGSSACSPWVSRQQPPRPPVGEPAEGAAMWRWQQGNSAPLGLGSLAEAPQGQAGEDHGESPQGPVVLPVKPLRHDISASPQGLQPCSKHPPAGLGSSLGPARHQAALAGLL